MPRRSDDPLVNAVIDRVLESPAARSVLGRVEYILDRVGAAIDPSIEPVPPPPPAGEPPPYATRESQLKVARRVLGFTPSEPLTVKMVAKRRREMARKNHPDAGGSAEKMAAVNRAADLLQKSL